MKVVILAGGMQSSIHSGREGIPKPMIDIGGKPLLWHIMKHFSEYGLREFIICGGYRIDMIKEYFMDFYIYQSDITVNLKDNTIEIRKEESEDWIVTVVDTGVFASTGQRISRIQNYTEGDFIVTYGDCLSDIDPQALLFKHKKNGKIATMAVTKPTGRNRLLPMDEDGNLCYEYGKEDMDGPAWVNADCMVFTRDVFAFLQGNYDLERQLFVKLAEKQQLATYKHNGFWTAVETKRDLVAVENLWNANAAPWIRQYQENG